MLVLLWVIILGIALLVYLAYPIFAKMPTDFVETHPDKAVLHQERQHIYAALDTALEELDEDYETGKLSKADYNELRTALFQETAQIIQRLENSAITDVEAEIERYKEEKRS